jgi:hypothetical protein
MGTQAKQWHIWVPRYNPWHKSSTLSTMTFRKHGVLKTFATPNSLPATHTVLNTIWRDSVSGLRWANERTMCTFGSPVTIHGTTHQHSAP